MDSASSEQGIILTSESWIAHLIFTLSSDNDSATEADESFGEHGSNGVDRRIGDEAMSA